MNAEFLPAFERLLELEGGYAPKDNGNGAVNRGITADLLRRIGRPFDVVSVRNLSLDETLNIYHDYFWKPIKGDALRNQVLANLLLATAVHSGHGRAVKLLQEVLQITSDGVVGPKTLAAIDAFGVGVAPAYAERIMAFYSKLAMANPNMYADDIAGWRGRLQALVPNWRTE